MVKRVGLLIYSLKTFKGLHHKTLEKQKTSKIWRDFGQFQTLIANISGTNQDVDKQKMAL